MKMTKMRIATLVVLSLVMLLIAVPFVLGSVNAPPVIFFGLQVPLWVLLLGAFMTGVIGCGAVFTLPLHWANRDVNHALRGMESEIYTLRNRQPEQPIKIRELSEIEQEKIDYTLEVIHGVHGGDSNQKAKFFEELVCKILLAMGYGFSQSKDAGRVTGKSGDGGVDTIIDQDLLGFHQIYVQAKCWMQRDEKGKVKSIGPGEIRNFRGALDMRRAEKGIFFTTTSFSDDAVKTADSSGIRLVDGSRLVQLMVSYGVGFKGEELDEDFFSGD